MKNKLRKINRSGDVNLIEIDKLPDNLTEIKHNGEYITARGEMTGSVHKLVVDRPQDMKIMKDGNGNTYIQLFAVARHTHTKDHETTFVLPKIYKQVPEREVDHFADSVVRIVKD